MYQGYAFLSGYTYVSVTSEIFLPITCMILKKKKTEKKTKTNKKKNKKKSQIRDSSLIPILNHIFVSNTDTSMELSALYM